MFQSRPCVSPCSLSRAALSMYFYTSGGTPQCERGVKKATQSSRTHACTRMRNTTHKLHAKSFSCVESSRYSQCSCAHPPASDGNVAKSRAECACARNWSKRLRGGPTYAHTVLQACTSCVHHHTVCSMMLMLVCRQGLAECERACALQL